MKKRTTLIVAAVIAALIVIAGFITMYQGSANEIVAVADQFKPDPSWQQVDNQVIPPKVVCLDAECPSVHRSWKTGENLTEENLQRVLDNSSWGSMSLQGDCRTEAGTSGTVPICSTNGIVNNFSVDITVWGAEDSTGSTVVLSIRE